MRRRRIRRAAELLAGLGVAASALPLIARHWWVADLFSHFRVQLVVALLLHAAATWVLAQRAWAAVLLIAAGAHVAVSYEYWLPTRSSHAEPDLRVMTANVEAENTQAAGLIAQIESERPDIVAIIEYNDAWAARLASLHETFTHRIEIPRSDRFGIALLSRWPVIEHEIVDLRGTPAIDARLAARSGDVRIIAAHAVPPITGQAAARRRAQLEQLAALSAAATEPLVVVGDLNVSPYSPHFADFLAQGRLHDALLGHGPSMTWPTFFPLLGIPIDHCLLGPHWDSIAYRRKPAYGSDHYAIAVDLIRK